MVIKSIHLLPILLLLSMHSAIFPMQEPYRRLSDQRNSSSQDARCSCNPSSSRSPVAEERGVPLTELPPIVLPHTDKKDGAEKREAEIYSLILHQAKATYPKLPLELCTTMLAKEVKRQLKIHSDPREQLSSIELTPHFKYKCTNSCSCIVFFNSREKLKEKLKAMYPEWRESKINDTIATIIQQTIYDQVRNNHLTFLGNHQVKETADELYAMFEQEYKKILLESNPAHKELLEEIVDIPLPEKRYPSDGKK